MIYHTPKTELRLRRYKQSKIARKLGFRGREVNRNIPDPDLDRARIPRRRRYCSPATTGKEAAAGDEGTGGRGGGCRGGAGVVGLTAHSKSLEEIFLSLTQTQEVK